MNVLVWMVLCHLAVGQAQSHSVAIYEAMLAPLDSSGVTGGVTIFVTPTGLMGIGSASGLEGSLDSTTNCTDTNGCGVHVHSGSACDNSTTQGGHYYSVGEDPWTDIKYPSTTSQGAASFSFIINTNDTDIAGKPFVVHDNAGIRVACGQLQSVAGNVSSANLEPIDACSSTASGSVTVYTPSQGGKIIGAGVAENMESDLVSSLIGGTDCTESNGCGTHVHSGTACDTTDTQGGHHFTPGGPDPWTSVGYTSTSSTGATSFIFEVVDSATVDAKPFIIHNDAGGRVSCGILQAGATWASGVAADVSNCPTTTSTTTTVETAGAAIARSDNVLYLVAFLYGLFLFGSP